MKVRRFYLTFVRSLIYFDSKDDRLSEKKVL